MQQRSIFLLAPMSRLGSVCGELIASSFFNVIAAIDDERNSTHIHGVPRWTAEQFLARASQYPDALAIDLSVSQKGHEWGGRLCSSAGMECCDFDVVKAELMSLPARPQKDKYNFDVLRVLRSWSAVEVERNANPIMSLGKKVYSQNEEDGIIFEILRRIGIRQGVFFEYGVEYGAENNTLALLACGCKGGASNEGLAFSLSRKPETGFLYSKSGITLDNFVDIYRAGLSLIGQRDCDFISMDVDGNDWHFVKALLDAGTRPSLFVTEYNAKFIPPIRFVMDYDRAHQWTFDDYFGAGFSSFFDLFSEYGYFPVCCNITGSNAFFVHSRYKYLFQDVPGYVDRIFVPPNYFLSGLECAGHPISLKTSSAIVNRG